MKDFSWGDTVGASEATKLQHAVGIELLGGDLYVADTYNHRIKIIDSQSTNSRVVVGNGEPGFMDGFGNAAQLDEPSGLSGADGTLFIADTNNHRIRTLDVATGELATLHFTNQQAAALLRRTAADEIVTFPLQTVAPGVLDLTVELLVPAAYEFNTDGTFVLDIEFKRINLAHRRAELLPSSRPHYAATFQTHCRRGRRSAYSSRCDGVLLPCPKRHFLFVAPRSTCSTNSCCRLRSEKHFLNS